MMQSNAQNASIFPLTKNHHSFISLAQTENTFSPTADTQNFIEAGWTTATEKMTSRNWPFFDGELVRLEHFEETKDSLQLFTSHNITYSHVVGTRAHPYSKWHLFEKTQLPRALSIASVVITSDNYIVLKERSLGDWDVSFEIPGGFMRRTYANPHEAMRLFLAKDLRLTDAHITSCSWLALYEVPVITEAIMLYITHLSLSKDELRDYCGNAVVLHCFENTEAGWEKLIQKNDIPLHMPSRLLIQEYFNSKQLLTFQYLAK
jgi:hypothetical protein